MWEDDIIFSKDLYLEIGKGTAPGHSVIHKFGRSSAIDNVQLRPIASASVYQTPTSAQSLEVLSSSANDTSAGSGAQQVVVEGLDSNWAVQTETVTMNGVTAVALANTYIRVYRMYVSRSGTYANATAGSHEGTITLRGAGAGSTWAIIELYAGFPLGQSEIAVYTVPAGYTAFLKHAHATIDSGKSITIAGFKRENADDVSTPYTGVMRIFDLAVGITDSWETNDNGVPLSFPEKTDIGFMAYRTSAGTADVSINFELTLIED